MDDSELTYTAVTPQIKLKKNASDQMRRGDVADEGQRMNKEIEVEEGYQQEKEVQLKEVQLVKNGEKEVLPVEHKEIEVEFVRHKEAVLDVEGDDQPIRETLEQENVNVGVKRIKKSLKARRDSDMRDKCETGDKLHSRLEERTKDVVEQEVNVDNFENKTLASIVSRSKSRYSMDLFNESNEGITNSAPNTPETVLLVEGRKKKVEHCRNQTGNVVKDVNEFDSNGHEEKQECILKVSENNQSNQANVENSKNKKRLSLDLFDSSGEEEDEDIEEDKTFREDLNKPLELDANLGGESLLEMSMQQTLSDTDSPLSRQASDRLKRKSLKLSRKKKSSPEKKKKVKRKSVGLEEEKEVELWNNFRKSLTLENSNTESVQSSVPYVDISAAKEVNVLKPSEVLDRTCDQSQVPNSDNINSEATYYEISTRLCMNIEKDQQDVTLVTAVNNSNIDQRPSVGKPLDPKKLDDKAENINLEIEDSLFDSTVLKTATVLEKQMPSDSKSNQPKLNIEEELFLKPKLLPPKKSKSDLEEKEKTIRLRDKEITTEHVTKQSAYKFNENNDINTETSRLALLDSSFPSATLLENQIRDHVNNVKGNPIHTVDRVKSVNRPNVVITTAELHGPYRDDKDTSISVRKPQVCKFNKSHDGIKDLNSSNNESEIEDSIVIDSSIAQGNTDQPGAVHSKSHEVNTAKGLDMIYESSINIGVQTMNPTSSIPKPQEPANQKSNFHKTKARTRSTQSKLGSGLAGNPIPFQGEPSSSRCFESQFPNISAIEREIDIRSSGKSKTRGNTLERNIQADEIIKVNLPVKERKPTKRYTTTKNTVNVAMENIEHSNVFQEEYNIDEHETIEPNPEVCQDKALGGNKKVQDSDRLKERTVENTKQKCDKNNQQPTVESAQGVIVVDISMDSDSDFIDDDLCRVSQTSYDKRRANDRASVALDKKLRHRGKQEIKSKQDESHESLNDRKEYADMFKNTQYSKKSHVTDKEIVNNRQHVERKNRNVLVIENSSGDDSSPESKRYKVSDTRQNAGKFEAVRVKCNNKHISDESSFDSDQSEVYSSLKLTVDSKNPPKENGLENNNKELLETEKFIEETMEVTSSVSKQSLLDSSRLFEKRCAELGRRMRREKSQVSTEHKGNAEINVSKTNNELNRTPTTSSCKQNVTPTTSRSNLISNTPSTQKRKSLTTNDLNSLLNLNQRFKNINETLFSSPRTPDVSNKRIAPSSKPTKEIAHTGGHVDIEGLGTKKRKNILEDLTTPGDKRRKLHKRTMIQTNLTGIVFNDTTVSFCNVIKETKANKKTSGTREENNKSAEEISKENSDPKDQDSDDIQVCGEFKLSQETRSKLENNKRKNANVVGADENKRQTRSNPKEPSESNTIEPSRSNPIQSKRSSTTYSKQRANSSRHERLDDANASLDGTITQYEKGM